MPRLSPRALPWLLLLGLAAGCRKKTPDVALPAAPAAKPPAAKPRAAKRRAALRLEPGLRLTLLPNLPGVAPEDLPLTSQRDVEVLGFDGQRLRLKWSGKVRRETGASARRREDWVRQVSRTSRAPGPPSTPPPGDYEEALVGGTLEFPNFATATSLLLPGLWPEQHAVIENASAIWLPTAVRGRLLAEASSKLGVLPVSRFLLEPAASLLRAAARVARESESPQDPDLLVAGPSAPVRVHLEGSDTETELPAFQARSFLGRYEVLLDEGNPLVTSLLPEPVASAFAPARVLDALLGYRVSAMSGPRR